MLKQNKKCTQSPGGGETFPQKARSPHRLGGEFVSEGNVPVPRPFLGGHAGGRKPKEIGAYDPLTQWVNLAGLL